MCLEEQRKEQPGSSWNPHIDQQRSWSGLFQGPSELPRLVLDGRVDLPKVLANPNELHQLGLLSFLLLLLLLHLLGDTGAEGERRAGGTSQQEAWYLQLLLLALEQDVLQGAPAPTSLLPLLPLPPLQDLLKLRPAAQDQTPASRVRVSGLAPLVSWLVVWLSRHH